MTSTEQTASPPSARLVTKMRLVAELIPYAKNSRTHSDDQIKRIAASIQEFGWTNPILVDSTSGIVAGHGRLAAAKLLGLAEVPTIELSGLSEAQRRAYVIFDNQVALEAGWDDTLRAAEIAELQAHNFDLTLIGDIDADAILKGASSRKGVQKTTFKTASIAYNIAFDTKKQQDNWFAFVRQVKLRYPNAETLAERISAFLTERRNG